MAVNCPVLPRLKPNITVTIISCSVDQFCNDEHVKPPGVWLPSGGKTIHKRNLIKQYADIKLVMVVFHTNFIFNLPFCNQFCFLVAHAYFFVGEGGGGRGGEIAHWNSFRGLQKKLHLISNFGPCLFRHFNSNWGIKSVSYGADIYSILF